MADDSNEKITSGTSSGGDASEELAKTWYAIGCEAANNGDFKKSAVYYGRALQIWTAYHGEDAPVCANAYHIYGRVLLEKARKEADPTSSLAKNVRKFREYFNDDAGTGSYSNTTGVSVSAQQGDESEAELDCEGLFGSEKDQSDLDLANKMLGKARDIAMKDLTSKMSENARFISDMPEARVHTLYDMFSCFAEVALAREDFESFKTRHEDTLLVVGRMYAIHSANVDRLYSRLCVYLESDKPLDAIKYGEMAISVCEDGMKCIKAEADIESVKSPASTRGIELLSYLCAKMRQKVIDLQTTVSNAGSGGNIEFQSDTDIGTSGTGGKREFTSSAADPSPTNKRSTDSPPNKDGSTETASTSGTGGSTETASPSGTSGLPEIASPSVTGGSTETASPSGTGGSTETALPSGTGGTPESASPSGTGGTPESASPSGTGGSTETPSNSDTGYAGGESDQGSEGRGVKRDPTGPPVDPSPTKKPAFDSP